MVTTQHAVGDAVAVGRLGLDDEDFIVGAPLRCAAVLPRHPVEVDAGVDGHALAANARHQRDAAVAHAQHRLEALAERSSVKRLVRLLDMREGLLVQRAEQRRVVGHALLHRAAALVLQLDFHEAQRGLDVLSNAHLDALTPALVVVVVAAPVGVVEVAGVVREAALAVDFQHLEAFAEFGGRGCQHRRPHHVLVVQPLQHRGLRVQCLQADRVEVACQPGVRCVRGVHRPAPFSACGRRHAGGPCR